MAESSILCVCAVVVSYHPDAAALAGLVETMSNQTGAVVLVDNGSDGLWKPSLDAVLASRGGALLQQSRNVGLAAAQNLGIAWARTHGFTHVLLLDQDSEPDQDMVPALLRALQELSLTSRVAAVGPRFHDVREHRDAPFVKVRFPLNRKLWCEASSQTIACDFLISSGTLIPMTVLDQVGAMDAELFIDNIDMEWGFRAMAQGFSLHGVCAASMHHRLGDARRPLPFGLGHVVVHGPARLYYMMRNRVRLYRLPHTPRRWIAQDLPRVLVKLLLFGMLIGPRRRNLRAMLRGLGDGLRGRHGESALPL
jgi:rhamnosyltransferase